jgi:hypothetical protein
MANMDIQAALASFKRVVDDGKALKAHLAALGPAGISDTDEAALQALGALAVKGQSLLAAGARRARNDARQALTDEIQGLEASIAFGAEPSEINSRIANLTAQRAALLQEEVGDFSDIIDPETVQKLLALVAQVHHAAAQKKQAAAIVGLVGQVVQSAADVAAAVAVAA